MAKKTFANPLPPFSLLSPPLLLCVHKGWGETKALKLSYFLPYGNFCMCA